MQHDILDWILEQKKDVRAKTGELWVKSTIYLFIFKGFIYLFMRDTEEEAEIYAEGEAGSLRGVWCETLSQEPTIANSAKSRRSTTELPRRPITIALS